MSLCTDHMGQRQTDSAAGAQTTALSDQRPLCQAACWHPLGRQGQAEKASWGFYGVGPPSLECKGGFDWMEQRIPEKPWLEQPNC